MSLRALYDLPAPAKLNLFLHVVGRRTDGYHLLQSPFVLLDWSDTLHFELRSDSILARHDLGATLPADDLCLRAARALQSASGTAAGVDISIDKQVPWGAGMGGGSSDAAATLVALNRLWGLHWSRDRLAHVGLSLGADVPFFVRGRNAWVEGIGEIMRPIAVPVQQFVVVKPATSLATREIFGHPALSRNTPPVIVSGFLEDGCGMGVPASWLEGFGRNDLQPPAEDRCPEVAIAARWLESRFGNSRMTGSGSAVFARIGATEPPTATPLEADLSGLPQGWVVRVCRSLVSHPLAGWPD
jgi:4-diphosphocytidyl-2-C-methyl-D-erythritol kinase